MNPEDTKNSEQSKKNDDAVDTTTTAGDKQSENKKTYVSQVSNVDKTKGEAVKKEPLNGGSDHGGDGDTEQKEDDSDDDEAEIVEESPCGRWLKRREQVKYRDVPGVDTAFLAMDSEEGVEVVWNEAQFSTAKKFKAQEDKLKNVFEALTLIDHPNIVRFHRYWIDPGSVNEKTGEKKTPRLIFITEYMSSGSLKQFLRRTKKNNRKIPLQSWKRWCTQILSALSYLHQTCEPPIIHGNLTCDTIFIQHNGLVKIGSIAPDIIHQNVKTMRDNIRNLHYLAPEWGGNNPLPGTPSDVYAFGMCALETAAMEILTTTAPATEGESSTTSEKEKEGEKAVGIITEETIKRTIESLEDEMQKDFIKKCLMTKPEERPTARELLFHPVLFEVHSLKLLAAHSLVNTPANINEAMTDEAIQSHYGLSTIMATVTKTGEVHEYKLSNVPVSEKLEKFMEDVKFGIYPITAFALSQPPPPKTRAVSPENQQDPERMPRESPGSKKIEKETRRVSQMLASIGKTESPGVFNFIVIIRLEDCMNRQLVCQITSEDGPDTLANELVDLNFICELDRQLVTGLFADVFRKLAVRSAKELSEALETLSAEHNSDSSVEKAKREEELTRQSVFINLKTYLPKDASPQLKEAVKNPREASKMRDPTFVAMAFPMPDGAFFCPPALEEGSEPFKIPPPGTNAFDCSHLEVQTTLQAPMQLLDQNTAQSASAPDLISAPKVAAVTESQPYDPYAYLQGAQKALEGLSLTQQQENHQIAAHEHNPEHDSKRDERDVCGQGNL